jgi:uncharacterized membrane protein
MKNFLIIFCTLIYFSSCTYDNIEEYYGETCDTLDVTFSTTVEPILDVNCVSCHNSSFGNGGVVLDSYAEVKKYADNGALLGVIDHQQGFEAMPPPPSTKLDDCTIAKVEKWIEQGAQNN